MNEVEFHYGCLADPLEKQANDQGYTLGKKAKELQEAEEAIITLMFANILTDSQKSKAYQKLHKKVDKSLKPLKKKEV